MFDLWKKQNKTKQKTFLREFLDKPDYYPHTLLDI